MKIRTLLLALTGLALATAGTAAADGERSTAELFETKCSVCHPLSRPLGKNKDRAGWENTVKRMQGKRPGHLSDSDVEAIVDYLTEVRGS